jgi:hypothetical protein
MRFSKDIEGNSLNNYSDDVSGMYSRSEQEIEDAKKRRQQLINKRPHNIRSLKSAIQDFERVYVILETLKVENSYKWLLSYISFTLASKANLIHSKYDKENADHIMKNIKYTIINNSKDNDKKE